MSREGQGQEPEIAIPGSKAPYAKAYGAQGGDNADAVVQRMLQVLAASQAALVWRCGVPALHGSSVPTWHV